MKTRIEFYIPVEKVPNFLRGEPVIYSSSPANGLIKLISDPEKIVFNKKLESKIFYIRKATFKESWRIKRGKKL